MEWGNNKSLVNQLKILNNKDLASKFYPIKIKVIRDIQIM